LNQVNLTGTEFLKIQNGTWINLKARQPLRGDRFSRDIPSILRG
jgi:hypothetical protein